MEIYTVPAAAAVFFSILAFGHFVLSFFDRHQRQLHLRLKGCRSPALEPVSAEKYVSLSVWLSKLLPRNNQARERHQQTMIKAGFYQPQALAVFFLFRLCCLFLPVIGLFAVSLYYNIPLRSSIFIGGGCAILGIFLPSNWLERRIKRRILLLQLALPDFLDMVTVCLGSGLGLHAAVLKVVDEIKLAHPLLANEMEIVVRDMQLGFTIDAAFARFGQRTGCPEITAVSTMLKEAQKYGSDLIAPFETQADTMRFEREQKSEEAAHKLSVKILFPMLLLIMPAVFVVLAGPAVLKILKAFN